MSREIDIGGLVNLLSENSGHNLCTTICEEMDNTDDADGTLFKAFVTDDYLIAFDNAKAMSQSTLKNAMTLFKQKPRQVGETGLCGMALKTCSFSISCCKERNEDSIVLLILTKQEKDKTDINVGYVVGCKNNWQDYITGGKEREREFFATLCNLVGLNDLKSGTIIIIPRTEHVFVDPTEDGRIKLQETLIELLTNKTYDIDSLGEEEHHIIWKRTMHRKHLRKFINDVELTSNNVYVDVFANPAHKINFRVAVNVNPVKKQCVTTQTKISTTGGTVKDLSKTKKKKPTVESEAGLCARFRLSDISNQDAVDMFGTSWFTVYKNKVKKNVVLEPTHIDLFELECCWKNKEIQSYKFCPKGGRFFKRCGTFIYNEPVIDISAFDQTASYIEAICWDNQRNGSIAADKYFQVQGNKSAKISVSKTLNTSIGNLRNFIIHNLWKCSNVQKKIPYLVAPIPVKLDIISEPIPTISNSPNSPSLSPVLSQSQCEKKRKNFPGTVENIYYKYKITDQRLMVYN
jgi:hypothetical protein